MVFESAQFDALVRERHGLTTKEAQAAWLGIPRPTYSKVANGRSRPNSEFIAAVWIKCPNDAQSLFRAEVR